MYTPRKFRGNPLYVLECNDALKILTSVWQNALNDIDSKEDWNFADRFAEEAMWEFMGPMTNGLTGNGYSELKLQAWHSAWHQARMDMFEACVGKKFKAPSLEDINYSVYPKEC